MKRIIITIEDIENNFTLLRKAIFSAAVSFSLENSIPFSYAFEEFKDKKWKEIK